VAEEAEVVVILKTRQERWQDLLDATQAMHPYKVPELLSVAVTNGIERYLDWVTSETIGPEHEEMQ
jgi:periplasmic divalent cation tolerance protein